MSKSNTPVRHRKMIAVTLGPSTIARLDEIARRTARSRSAVIEQLTREAPLPREPPRFDTTTCAQCGVDLGPGDAGASHCADHLLHDRARDKRT